MSAELPPTNLVATLQPTGGVTSPGSAQTYGALLAGGPALSRPFTFTASGACGGIITATLQLPDGAEPGDHRLYDPTGSIDARNFVLGKL